MSLNSNLKDLDIYKIKDSVDLFLTDEKLITAFFMNTRVRKNFRVNEPLIRLIENIDGKKSIGNIKTIMADKYGVEPQAVLTVFDLMIKNKILSKIVDTNIISKSDEKRFSRQINYFSEFFDSEEKALLAQKKLFCTKLLVFGCGAIGGNIALQLAMAGVRNISLFDYDVVDSSDTTRHLYYSDDNIKLDKIEALKKAIINIDKKVKVEIIKKRLKPTDDIENLISTHDFVVNTLDEPYIGYTSSKISRICVKHKIPHFIAGGFDAHLSSTGELIIPYVTPCVECYAGYFKKTLKNWKPAKHPIKNREKDLGGLAAQSLFSSSYATMEIIKYITNIVDMYNDFKIRGEFLFSDMSLTYLNVKKNSECPICGEGVKL